MCIRIFKIIRCEWFYKKIQPYFEQHTTEVFYRDAYSFLFSFKQTKRTFEDLKHFEEKLDRHELDPSQELSSQKKFFFEKMELETAPELDLDEAKLSMSKIHSIKTKPNESETKHTNEVESL